jgi:hypothetical protein
VVPDKKHLFQRNTLVFHYHFSFRNITTNSSDNVKANLKISFTALNYKTAIELQEILDNMVIEGEKTEIVQCSSDDDCKSFYCDSNTGSPSSVYVAFIRGLLMTDLLVTMLE